MAIRSDEITSIIKASIDSFDAATETRSVGTVVEVGDGIAQIFGLDDALASEMLEFPGGVMGMALNLEEETVGAVILGNASAIKEGDQVRTTGRVVEVPVGAALLGRVVDPLGNAIDGKGEIPRTKVRPVERITERIEHPPQDRLANGDRKELAEGLDLVALFDVEIITEDDDADATTTTVYSIAPADLSFSTTVATVERFCPMAT